MNDETLSEAEKKRLKKNAAQLEYYYRHKQLILKKQKALRESDPTHKQRHRAYSKSYVLRNPESRKRSVKKYYDANPNKCCAASVRSGKKARKANPDLVRKKLRDYFARNPQKWRSYFSNWNKAYRRTERGKVACRIRGRIWMLIKESKIGIKRTHVDSLRILDWFEWLKFKGVVDWTQPGIDVDHVIPISAFNLNNEGVMRYANKWWNLLPMVAFENRSKGAKICRVTYQKARKLAAEYIYETGASTSY
jgi:hypothetical protein